MKHKTDLHCHTAELSGCASENLYDTVEKYIKYGYTSLAITNHFKHVTCTGERFNGNYKAYVDAHFAVAEEAARAAGERINIIPGIELMLPGGANEYLIFGGERETFYGIPHIFESSIGEIHEYFASRGCVVIQAHPMRWGTSLVRPEHIDGYEVLNTHKNHDSHNDIAEIIAERIGGAGKIRTAGTDHHDGCQIPDTGILTDAPIRDGAELVRVLKSGNYEIFREM